MKRAAASAWLLMGCVALATAAPYVMDARQSELQFSFRQAGAVNQGSFRKFSTELRFDPGNLASSSLSVTVDIASLDTRDKERDDLLRGADLFDVAHYPTATFRADGLTRRQDGGYDARGKMRIRDVTRDLTAPFSIQVARAARLTTVALRGTVVIRRLEFGVGRGDWQSTEWVDNDVTIRFDLQLTSAIDPPAVR